MAIPKEPRTIALYSAIALFAVAFSTLASPQERATASVAGIVVHVGTGEPISEAEVRYLRLPAPPGMPPSIVPVVTDAQGRFTLRDLVPGEYRFSFAAARFVSQDYGQKTFPGQGSSMTLNAGQAVENLTVRLTPAGTISGRVRDSEGRPVVGGTVQLLRNSYNSAGTRIWQIEGLAATDDRGEYRIFWVTPGRYVIEAGRRTGIETLDPSELPQWAGLRNGAYLFESLAAVFYPNAPNIDAASAVQIHPGTELSGLDFQLDRQKSYRIRGRVIDSATSQPPRNAHIVIRSRGDYSGDTSIDFYKPATGDLEITGVAPGSYTVSAIVQNASDPTRFQDSSYAMAEVTVVDGDVENVLLDVGPPKMLRGRISVDGGGPLPPPFRFLFRSGYPDGHPNSNPVSEIVNADGTFSVPLVAGEFRLVPPRTIPYYIRQINYRGTSLTDGVLHFDGFDVSSVLEVVLSTKMADVRGVVVDTRLQPIGGATVVLVPERFRERPELYKQSTSDAEGRYAFPNVAPGDYRIFAWETVEPNLWFDSAFLKSSEAGSPLVRLRESSKEVMDVNAIPAGGPK